MLWNTTQPFNSLHLKTDAGGVITLYREEEIRDWLENQPGCKGGAKWRGFRIVEFRLNNDTKWESAA